MQAYDGATPVPTPGGGDAPADAAVTGLGAGAGGPAADSRLGVPVAGAGAGSAEAAASDHVAGAGTPSADARVDVLVVGCGPVGAVLAARLGALGLSVVAVERATAPYPLPRAVAADDEVAQLLAGLDSGLLAGALTDVGVRFVGADRRSLGELAFPRGPAGHSGLTLFHQPTLEERLRAVVTQVADLRLGVGLASWTQDASGVSAVLDDGSRVRSRWLVGCDGAGSQVRQVAGIAWRGRDLARPWLVVDVVGRVDRPALTYTCDPGRPQVDMPVPGGHRWEWLLGRDEPAPDPLPLLARDVDARGDDHGAFEVVRAVTYRYGARRADRWQAGRVLLAGDAAHTMPPFAGQGLGAGVRDAWALAALLASGDPSGYQALRAPHVAAMTRLSLFLGAVVETRSTGLTLARDAVLRKAFRTPGLGPWLSRGGPRSTASGVLHL